MVRVKRDEIPMSNIGDLRAWHQAQVERHERLATTRKVESFNYERQRRKHDLRSADFHKRCVQALDAALNNPAIRL